MKKTMRVCVGALVVIVLAGAGFRLWKYLDSRPRVYADARADALAALAEEVGKAAVDKGVLTVPESVRVPRQCAVYAAGFFVALNGPQSLLYAPPPSGSRGAAPLGMWRLAPLDEARARRIAAALSYLAAARGEGFGDDFRDPSFLHWDSDACPALQIYGAPGQHSAVWPSPGRPPIAAEAGARAAARYMAAVAASARYLESPADIAALARATLESALPVASPAQEALAGRAAAWLGDYPDAGALAPLRQVERIRVKRGKPSFARGWPLLGKYLSHNDDYALPYTASAAWCAENLAGKSEGEQRAFLSKVLSGGADEKTGGVAGERAAEFFARHWPKEFAAFVAANWGQMPAKSRSQCLRWVSPGAADLDAVGSLVLADSDRDVRAGGCAVLCGRTGEEKYAAALMADLGPLAGLNDADTTRWDRRCRELCGLYMEHRNLAAIPPFLAKMVSGIPRGDDQWAALGHREPEGDKGFAVVLAGILMDAAAPPEGRRWESDAVALGPSFAIASVLAAAGGPDNVDALMHMLDCYGDTPPAETGRGVNSADDWPPCLTIDARRSLAESTDAALADAMAEYVKSEAPEYEGRVCEAFIYALAARGDARLVPLLEAAAAASASEGAAKAKARRRDAVEALYAGGQAAYDEALLPGARFTRALLMVRLKDAPDPLALLEEARLTASDMVRDSAADALAAKYPVGELQTVLASEKRATLRPTIYLAIVRRRQLEETAAMP